METAPAFFLELDRDLDGIFGVGRLSFGIALDQPDRPATAQVDRRDHDHAATAFTKRS